MSRLRGAAVAAGDMARIGRLDDVCADVADGRLTGLLVRAGRHERFVPIGDVVALDPHGVRVTNAEAPHAFHRADNEVRLARELLDRQVVDRVGLRVVRVNDIALTVDNAVPSIAGVDATNRGLWRRLMPRRLGGFPPEALIAWADVEPIAADLPDARVFVSHRALEDLHPADLARLADHLPHRHGAELLARLDSGTVADVVEEIERKRQGGLLEHLPEGCAVAVLNEMAPDAAADLLGHLRQEETDRLLAEMDPPRAAVVRLLLTYPADSAGGLMTTDFVIALEHDTGRQAVKYIRGQLKKPDLTYYVYVVDDPDNRRLRGIVSLRDLLLADPDEPLTSYMAQSVRVVRPGARADDAARVMRDYNLLALPVVDDESRMLGIITADDALDVVLPEHVRRHVPRLFS